MKYINIILSLLLLLVMGCSNLRELKCPPNGEPVIVLEDISLAYPVYASAYDLNLKSALKLGEEFSSSADINFREKITKFREDLNQESSRIQMLLQTALLGLQTTPCDKDARRSFSSILARINENSLKLSQLEQNINGGRWPFNDEEIIISRRKTIELFIIDYQPIRE